MSVPLDDMRSELPEHLLLFDGVCNLCNGLVGFIIRHDGRKRFHFAPLQSVAGQNVLQRHDLVTSDFHTLVYFRKGVLLTRSTAALNVARDLGGTWMIAYTFILVPRFLRDAVYDLISRRRFRWFGKRDSCMVPTPELRSRFLI